MITNLTFEDW